VGFLLEKLRNMADLCCRVGRITAYDVVK